MKRCGCSRDHRITPIADALGLPKAPQDVRRNRRSFPTPQAKAAWLSSFARQTGRDPRLTAFANRLTQHLDPNDTEGRVREIHRFVRDSIRYQHDPMYEQFAHPWVILNKGFDDCDGKSTLFVALLVSLGIDARIRPVYNALGQFVHVQGEAKWKRSERFPGNRGGWVLAELTLKGVELGCSPTTGTRDASGHLLLA